MKALIRTAAIAAVVIVGLAFASSSFAFKAKDAGEKASKCIGTIEKIDATAKTVTVKDKNGESKTFSVEDASSLDNLKEGDKVVVSYTEADGKSVAKKITKAGGGSKKKSE